MQRHRDEVHLKKWNDKWIFWLPHEHDVTDINCYAPNLFICTCKRKENWKVYTNLTVCRFCVNTVTRKNSNIIQTWLLYLPASAYYDKILHAITYINLYTQQAIMEKKAASGNLPLSAHVVPAKEKKKHSVHPVQHSDVFSCELQLRLVLSQFSQLWCWLTTKHSLRAIHLPRYALKINSLLYF